MSNESSVNSVEMVDRARSWDHPNGLGWQLWRRAQSTGLLIQPIQRDLALFRASIRDPAPLASDIRRRWGVGANTSVDRFGLDLPFFLGRFPFFRGSTAQHLSESGPGTAHRSADISRSSSAYSPSRFSEATTSPNPLDNEADPQESAQAMAPQSAAGFSDTIVPSLARRAIPAAVSLNQERSGRNDSRFPLTTLPARRSLLPQTLMTTLQRLPLVSGTRLLSSAILERYASIPALVQRSRAKVPETENRSVLALMQPFYEASAPLKTTARSQFVTTANRSPSVPDALARDAAARQGELQAGAQDSSVLTAQSVDYAPSSVSPRDLQPAIPVAGQRERTISRTASSKPGGVNSMSEGTALTTDRDVTIRTVKGNLAPQRPGVGGGTTLQPGGVMTGMILRALETRSPAEVRPPLPAVMPRQYTQIVAPYRSNFSTSFSARGFVPTLFRSSYSPAPRFASVNRAEKPGVRITASSSAAEGSVGRNAIGSEQPLTDGIDAPVAKIQTDTAETKIAPSTGLPLTNPAMLQTTATVTRPFTDRADSGPGLTTRNKEGGIIRFGDVYNMPVFTARKMAIGLHATAMPLSIGPIFKRDQSIPGTTQQRIFPERSVGSALTVSRAEGQGPSRFDNSVRGDETGEGNRVFSGGETGVLRTHGIADNSLVSRIKNPSHDSGVNPANPREIGGRAGIQENQTSLDSRLRGNDEFGLPSLSTNVSTTALAFGRSVSRAGIETRHISGDSTRTSGGTMPGQPHVGELPATDVHDPLSMEVRISRAAVTGAGFGTARDYGDAGIPHGWLPISQAGLPLGGGIARTQRSLQRVTGRSAAPLLIARSGGIRTATGDQLPGITIPSQAIQSTEPLPVEWIRDVRAGESSEFHLPSAGLTSVLSPMRAMTTTPVLMRRFDVPARQRQHAPGPATRGISHDLPLAALSVMRDERSLAVLHRSNGTSLQTASQEAASAAKSRAADRCRRGNSRC